MSVLYKQPSESKVLSIEFADQLASGDSLASITSVTESTGGITIASTSISGTTVVGTYSSGTDGTTYHIVAIVVTANSETLEVDVFLRVEDAATTTMLASYFTLLDRVGHFLFGLRGGFTGDQLSDIEECIKDGLRDVYAANTWSFFRPVEEIITTAPYSTGTITVVNGVVTLAGGTFPSWAAVGVLKVSTNYYDVDTRDGDTQVTLEDTTIDVDAGTSYELGRPEYDMPSGFEDVVGNELAYEPGQSDFYPPVKRRHDDQLRAWRQDDPYHNRPLYFSIRTVAFVATTGSQRRLAMYPTPDAAYVLKARMKLRATMIDETNIYPVGGDMLSQVITEACLAAAERNFDEQDGRHGQRFQELLLLAIAANRELTSPMHLGPDAPKTDGEDLASRRVLLGTITLDGTEM